MRKIKDNGRTFKEVLMTSCGHCAIMKKENIDVPCQCRYNTMFKETLPSKLSRFIKRMVKNNGSTKIHIN